MRLAWRGLGLAIATLVSTLNTRDVVIAGWVTQLNEDFLNLVRADARQVARGPGT